MIPWWLYVVVALIIVAVAAKFLGKKPSSSYRGKSVGGIVDECLGSVGKVFKKLGK